MRESQTIREKLNKQKIQDDILQRTLFGKGH